VFPASLNLFMTHINGDSFKLASVKSLAKDNLVYLSNAPTNAHI